MYSGLIGCVVPVAPKGCPSARDPPRRLVLLMSMRPMGLPPDD